MVILQLFRFLYLLLKHYSYLYNREWFRICKILNSSQFSRVGVVKMKISVSAICDFE